MSEETATEDATTSGDSGCGSDSVFTLASATDLLTIGSGERSKQKCPASPSKRWTLPQKLFIAWFLCDFISINFVSLDVSTR